MNNKIELLSPAGDLERLKIALLYGADAVFIGGQEYSLRANATNFSIDEIREACTFAKALGKKVYQTFNIVFHDEDLEGVEKYIDQVVAAGIDAFIVSDPFIIGYITTNHPSVEVHVSTQASTSNKESVLFFKELGASRVVLAREVGRDEIKEIIDETNVEIEVFIHGAMCAFFSGRCTLSNYLTNRDSNRGGCCQACRFSYEIDSQNEDKKFTMALKDLNLANYITDMMDIGVASLKVEGRMRSAYYLATVIGSYRKIIDNYAKNGLNQDFVKEQEQILGRVANRETSTHYYDHEADETDQYYSGRMEVSNQDYVALVVGYDENKKLLKVSQKNYFSLLDELEIFTPTGKVYDLKVTDLMTENFENVDVARHPNEILYIPFDQEISDFSMIRKKY